MVAAVCAEEFVARPSYMGCRNCDYGDLCEGREGRSDLGHIELKPRYLRNE